VSRAVLRCCGGSELLALKEASSAARRHAEAVQGGKLYVFGGNGSRRDDLLKAVECFDLNKGEWEVMPAMKVRRIGNVAGAIGGHIYVCGGLGEFGKIVEKFNFRQREWENCTPPARLSVHRAHAAAAVVGGRLYICGGEDSDAGIVHSSVECFDPRMAYGKGGCQVLPAQMLAARRLHAVTACPVLGQSDLLLLVSGGESIVTSPDSDWLKQGEHVLSTSEAFDVSRVNSTWFERAQMTLPRCCHSSVSLGWSIYVCGGTHGDGSPTPMVERYDRVASCWTKMPPTLTARFASRATVLADRLYVVGGMKHYAGAVSAESFDPAEGTWKWTPSMLQGRHSFAIVAVKWGRLLESSQGIWGEAN